MMALKNNEVIIAFFGQHIKNEPFLIDTDKSIGEKQQQLKKENKPEVLMMAMNSTAMGETFNKVLPDVEPFLKAIYDNKEFKSRLNAAQLVACKELNLSFKMEKKPVLTEDLNLAIKQQAKSQKLNRPKPKY